MDIIEIVYLRQDSVVIETPSEGFAFEDVIHTHDINFGPEGLHSMDISDLSHTHEIAFDNVPLDI